MTRPNLLLGHFPTSGAGAEDRDLVYGNYLYQNPVENLLQAEGNLVVFNNVFVNTLGGGVIRIAPHNDKPRSVDVFFNTIINSAGSMTVTGGAAGAAIQVPSAGD